MIDTIYIEDSIRVHPTTVSILKRFPKARVIGCGRYGEIFNRGAQNFRIQKKNPALILANKHQGHVLPAPNSYGIEGDRNYYFSHMLNCIYDCRYCFLQGMYRSAHYVLFVNYEDFLTNIDATLAQHNNKKTWFYSGYDCDSLALDPVTGFTDHILPFFADRPLAQLEFRTKSTQVRSLLNHEPLDNVVIAFSLSPEIVSQNLEAKTPGLQQRLNAMEKCQKAGWKVGIRFEPLIQINDFEQRYRELFDHVFSQLNAQTLHSVSVGAFRVPRDFFKRMTRLYPEEPLFSTAFTETDGMIGYETSLQESMLSYCTKALNKYVEPCQQYQCR